jgi:hypothetical protein
VHLHVTLHKRQMKHDDSIYFFLKRLKWNIIPNQNVLPSIRCTKEEQKSHNNMYMLTPKKPPKHRKKEKLLVNAQQSKWTKPPSMKI